MLVHCEKCDSKFDIDEKKLALTKTDASGRYKLRCAFCQEVFFIKTEAPKAVDPLFDEPEPEVNPDMMGTMVLNLSNKPKPNFKPPPKTSPAKVPAVVSQSTQAQPQPQESATEQVETASELKTASANLRRVVLPPQRKMELLRQSRWLETLSMEDLKSFAPFWELFRAVEDATVVFPAEDRTPFLALIVKGKVHFFGKESPTIELGLLEHGKSFGELSILDGLPRSCRAVADKDTFLLILTKKRAELMAKDYPKLWIPLLHKLTGVMAKRLREKMAATSELLYL